MQTFTQLLECDGGIASVFAYRTQVNCVAGTVWRFVLDHNQTIVAVPYQTPHAPASAAHCIPERIESIIGGQHNLGDFGFAVYHAAQTNNHTSRNANLSLQEATEAELEKWKASRKWPESDRWERDRVAAHVKREGLWRERGLTFDEDTPPPALLAQWRSAGKDVATETWNWQQDRVKEREKISDPLFAPLNEPERMKAVNDERAKVEAKRNAIEERLRKSFEAKAAKEEMANEAEALLELNQCIAKHGGKAPVQLPPLPEGATRYGQAASRTIIKALTNTKTKGGQILRTLYEFIREDICKRRTISPLIRDQDMRRILVKVKELTGMDIAESVLLDYSPEMQECVAAMAKETAAAETMEENEARQHVLKRIQFVAVFPDGKRTMLQALIRCVHDEADEELWRRVAPDEATRDQIQAELAAIEQKATLKRELMMSHERFLARSNADGNAQGDSQRMPHTPRRLATPAQCQKIFNMTQYHWRKLLRADVIKPVRESGRTYHRYDIDNIASSGHASFALSDAQIDALLRRQKGAA